MLFTPTLAKDRDEPRPLIVFLHGHGERGGRELSEKTLDKVMRTGLPKLCDEGLLPHVQGVNFPFLVAAPQSAGEGKPSSVWNGHYPKLLALVNELINSQHADRERCYLTGISVGAWAVWELAAEDDASFAGLIPVSGGMDPKYGSKAVAKAPVWCFVGEHERKHMYPDLLKDLDRLRDDDQGAEINHTVIPGLAHGDHHVWDDIYAQPDLYQWLLQTRTNAQPS